MVKNMHKGEKSVAEKTEFKTVKTSPKDLEELEEKIRKHRQKTVRRAAIAAAVIVGVVLIIQLWLALRTYSGFEVQSQAERKDSAATNYEMFQGKLLEYDNDGIMCYNTADEMIWNQSYEMTTPVLTMCGSYLVVYDRGGTVIYIMAENGLIKKIETATPINRVCIAQQGTVAVLMKEDNASYIRLYDKKGRELASGEFYEEKGTFPVDIALSPDAQKLAVDMLDVTKGKVSSVVNFYNFGSVGQNEIDNNVGSYTYKNVMISELLYTESGKLLAIGDTGLIWFDGAQKPAPKKEIKYDGEIQSLFYNKKYVGISYSDSEKENSWHIKVYDMNGATVMESDTEIAYNRIELLDNNEICVRDDYNCELFTIHSIRKFKYTFDRQLYDILAGSDGQNYTFVLNGEVEEVRLQ